MSYYYPVQDKSHLESYGYIKISAAWLMGAAALWLYANEFELVENYLVAYIGYLALTKFVALVGYKDYARSKGYSKWFALFSFVPVAGPGYLAFLADKWHDQPAPKVKVKKLKW